ncbi:MAG TPA: hypothetical protein VEL76_17670 [Gemmataceae bacterium]|nr:hypothetical protein [Gemmataceae bacterium]
MRTSLTVFMTVALLSLASGGSAQTQPAAGKGKLAPDKARADKTARWEVKGRGETIEEAEKVALARARTLVEEHLRRQQPPLRWSPSAEYIRAHLVSGSPQRLTDEDKTVNTPEGREYTLRSWSWTVTITPEQYRELVKDARREKASDRMLLAGKVTVGLVLLLAALAGYLRLDDWTKGAYTRWLVLALAGLLAGVGTGLVLLS